MSGLNKIFRELQNIVGLSSEFAKVLNEKPLLDFLRLKNLKDHIVRSKLRREGNPEGTFRCNKKRCYVVTLLDRGIRLRVPLLVGPTIC